MPEIQTPQEGTDDVQQDTKKPVEQRQQTPSPSQPEETVEALKEKLAFSARENQILRDAETNRTRAEQELTKEPTDSDLRTAFPEWDTLSDFEKKIARDNLVTKRIAASSAKKADDLTADRSWNTSIELALSSNPALQGKEHVFRQFASQPKYRGADMELLVSSFLHKNPAAPSTPVTPRPGLEPGNGGPRETPKPKTLSGEELSALRTSDYKAYEKYIKTHDIDIEV